MKVRSLFLVFVIIFTGLTAHATDLPMDRATLRGLKALKVVIDLPAGLEQTGITRAGLLAQVRQRLQNTDLTLDENALEFLGLSVAVTHEKKTPYAICLSLALYQNMSLVRDPAVKTITETWSAESLTLAPPKVLQQMISTHVNELVDQFVSAFRAAAQTPANPPQAVNP